MYERVQCNAKYYGKSKRLTSKKPNNYKQRIRFEIVIEDDKSEANRKVVVCKKRPVLRFKRPRVLFGGKLEDPRELGHPNIRFAFNKKEYMGFMNNIRMLLELLILEY